jgi:ribose transport system substrate-binding protein
VGFDAIKDSRAAIVNGDMQASIAQHPEEMGRLAVETALKALHGENVPSDIPVKIELVTKTKLDKLTSH